MVSDGTTDPLIGPVVRDVSGVDGAVHEYRVLLAEFDQGLLIPLIVSVVMANEYLQTS